MAIPIFNCISMLNSVTTLNIKTIYNIVDDVFHIIYNKISILIQAGLFAMCVIFTFGI